MIFRFFLCYELLLPVVHLLRYDPFGLNNGMFFPFGIIFHEPAQPQHPRQPHQYRLQDKQEQEGRPHPVKDTVVVDGESDTDQYFPGHKTGCEYGDTQSITHIPGTVIKTNFYFCGLSANRAAFVHMAAVLLVGTVFVKYFSLAAPGTAVAEHAGKVKPSFLILRHILPVDSAAKVLILVNSKW